VDPIANSYVNITGFQPSALTALAAAIALGTSSSGLTPYQQTTTLTVGQDTIVITANSGVLPVADQAILLLWDNGVVIQTDYTINRGGLPDNLVLDTPVIDTTTFTLLFFI
jgi:hypothetical protein